MSKRQALEQFMLRHWKDKDAARLVRYSRTLSHLAQAGCSNGLRIKRLVHLLDRGAQVPFDNADCLRAVKGRHIVLQADTSQTGLDSAVVLSRCLTHFVVRPGGRPYWVVLRCRCAPDVTVGAWQQEGTLLMAQHMPSRHGQL